MITIKDIAKESGYSIGTVSRALNGGNGVSEKAMNRIMNVVDKYNFKLNENAKFLKQRSNQAIAVILKGTKNMLFASLVEILQNEIEDTGYESLLFYLHEDEDEVLFAKRIIREKKPEGICFLGGNIEYFRNEFSSIHIPCVILTTDVSILGFDNLASVSTDDCKGAEFVIDELIRRGHTKIGIIGGDIGNSTPSQERYRGCLNSFRKNEVDFDINIQYENSHFSLEEGYECASRLLRKMPDITAIFAMSDVIALGAMRAASDRGIKVPEDLSIAGFDGIEIGDYMSPRLTTIRQNIETIADKSMSMLHSMISSGAKASYEIVPFSFVPGNSIGEVK